MSAILTRSLSIPEEIRPDVAEVVERTRNQAQFSQPDISYLFEVYNRYLTREPENINCSGCRTKVVGWLRAAVAEWRQNNILTNGRTD